jgi:alpha-tubulin suppressor-like RCC1 family protein
MGNAPDRPDPPLWNLQINVLPRRFFLLLGLALTSALVTTTPSHSSPVTDLKKIVLGKNHGCGITQAGALRCFGNNGQGQLGTDRRLPNDFAARALTVLPSGVTDVAISDGHTCAVVGGELFCWGSNEQGQLGLAKAGGDVKTPTKAAAVSGVLSSVAAGWGTTCVILVPKGSLQCWGRNDHGQVGVGVSNPMVLQPTTVIPSGVTAVAVGGQHACAVVNGGLQCWGFLLFRDDGFKTLYSPMPIIPEGQGVTAVAAGLHTCVIVKASLQCWGRNFSNQVGVPEGSRVAPKVPTTVIASDVLAMALSDENTCAVVKSGLKCWGSNTHAQLGIKGSVGSNVPMPLSVAGVPPASIHAVAIGMNQTCVLTGATPQPDKLLLQCTNRARLPDDVGENEPTPPDNPWLPFGTEDVSLSDPPPVLPRIGRYGLWQGTIGAQKVVVLLAPSGCEARYYYRRHLWAIPLEEKDRRQGKVWRELQDDGGEATWTFTALSPDARSLSGEWVSHDGQRHVPIRLDLSTPMSSTTGEDARPHYDCDVHSKAFDAPRIARARQERTVAKTDTLFKNGKTAFPYRQVSMLGDHIKSFALPDMSQVTRLQRALDDWEDESVSQFYGCAFSLSGRPDMTNPDFYRELAPQFWSTQLLVLREAYSDFCGGAHPNGGISGYLTWDVAADRPVDVWTWIKGADQPRHIVSKRLLDILMALYGRRNETGEDSCAHALEGQAYFEMYPSTAGMIFSPRLPHVAQACAEDIEVPWPRMRAFLTPTGQRAVSALLGVR